MVNGKGFSSLEFPLAPAVRDLQAASEIAQAFLTATVPTEVYRMALERVVPLVNASFGCVFLRDPASADAELLRVVAAYNWPQSFAPYLGELRVRIGNGPTGQAVAENQIVDVPDVFANPALEEWWEPARELQFISTVALPLTFGGTPRGAVTFYFREPQELSTADRSFMRLVADQLAATAQKAHLIEDLQRTNLKLHERNLELDARVREAAEARRLKDELLANVSHELRTPLTAILGYTYLLREGVSGEIGREQKSAVERIENAATALMGRIDDLLDLTHLKLNRVELIPQLCDAAELLRAAVATVGEPPPKVSIHLDAPEAGVPLVTDPIRAVRILEKLISNAFKFTSAGTIELRVRPAMPLPQEEPSPQPRAEAPTEGVVWEIEDSGVGIDVADQEIIFDEFRQVDGSVTRRFGGTGLGLALARQLARRLGGEVTVRSAATGGTVFTLNLPNRPSFSTRAEM